MLPLAFQRANTKILPFCSWSKGSSFKLISILSNILNYFKFWTSQVEGYLPCNGTSKFAKAVSFRLVQNN